MRLFITGGTGFIGKHLLLAATQRGHEVRALTRSNSLVRNSLFDIDWVLGDLASVKPTDLNGVDCLVHLAAAGVTTPTESPATLIQSNVIDFHRLLRLAAEQGITHYIVCGSCFEYGRVSEQYDRIPANAPLSPVDSYSGTKAAASLLAQSFALENQLTMSIVRPFQVYGDGEADTRLWGALCRAARLGNDLELTPGDQVRDFVSVQDVAGAIVDETEENSSQAAVVRLRNVGTGIGTSVRQFCEDWWLRLGGKGQLRFGAKPYRKNEVMRYVADLEIKPL